MKMCHVLSVLTSILLCPFLFGENGAPGQMTAAAEVQASAGPLQLTLRLHRTRIKIGESPWYQVELKNIGSKKVLVRDRFFLDPWELTYNSSLKRNMHLVVSSPDGTQVRPTSAPRQAHAAPSPGPGDPAEQKAVQSLADGWRREGLSTRQIDERLAAHTPEAAPDDDAFSFWLRPGETRKSRPSSSDDERLKPPPAPRRLGQFSELWQFDFAKAGRYRIIAVYDATPPERVRKHLKEIGMRIPEESVLVKTAPVEVDVMP